MVIFTALPPGSNSDDGRILVDESDYQGVDDEQLPFESKDVVRIRANEKFSQCYDCMDELGQGKFGKVYRCRERTTGLELAAKRIKIKRDADREKVEREVAIMTKLRHPRIAQIYDAFTTPDDDVVLIMEIVTGGELFDRVVDENYILTELSVVMIICQLCEAVSYIHSKNIVHLDIKPENIMCVSQTSNRIKLIDFGLAQFYDGSSNLLFMAGTPEFVAPEVIKFEPIDFYTDMWSIGVITYILLSGISPFLGETLGDTYVAVEKGEWEFDDEAFEGISDAAKDFISKLLIMDQRQRMLPEHCLNHSWIVDNRTKAANDLLSNRPNISIRLSKEVLKSYRRNKHFRKATWALVFLIRFKRKTLMSFGERKVTAAAAIADIYDGLPVSIEKIMRNCAESETNTFGTARSIQDGKKMKELLNDISAAAKGAFDTPKRESVIDEKHPEKEKLSSEIPKKKLKPNAINEGTKKLKPTHEGMKNKGTKKHKEKSSEESDGICCKQKKVSKHLKTASDGLEKQMKKSAETDSGCDEAKDSKKCTPVRCEICITLEMTKPAASCTEFSKPVFAAESAHLSSLITESVQTNMAEAQTVGGPEKHSLSSSANRTAQESTHLSSSVNKRSEINKKGSSVAAILTMFTEKADQERKRFERRPSRTVRTFRDVEKPSSRKTSLVAARENDGNCVKLYRAPDEEKKRMESLIELHRRGSLDRKQVDTKKIVTVKQEGESKSFSDQKVNINEKGKMGMEAERRNLMGSKMERNAVLKAKQGMKRSKKKVTDSTPPESDDTQQIGQITDVRSNGIFKTGKPGSQRNELKEPKKDEIEFMINPEMKKRAEMLVGNNLLVGEQQIQALSAVHMTATQDSIRSKEPKSWMKRKESENDYTLNPLSTTTKQPKNTKSNREKQTEFVNRKNALSTEPRFVEERCISKKEVATNASTQNVHKRRKNKSDRNADTKGAAQQSVLLKNSEKITEHRDISGVKEMKESVEKLKKETVSTKMVSLQGKTKQVKATDEKKCKIQKAISVSHPLSATVTTATMYNEENHADVQLQCITSKKTSKAAGISSCKEVIGKTTVRKLQDKTGSETKSICSDLNNEDCKVSKQNKLRNLTEGALHSIKNTASGVRKSVDIFPNSITPMCDTMKLNVPGKTSHPKNLLVRVRSETNLAKNKEKTRSVRRGRKTADAIFCNQDDRAQKDVPNVSIMDLKNHENFSFGWLKMQLETRVNKEKEQMGPQCRRALEISSLQSGNAKRALHIWKTMEQSFAKI